MSRVLPTGLAPWAGQLAALSPRLALELGPLVRRIDALVAERVPRTAPAGELDGYGGLARAVRPDRLLPSEWLLADQLPEEFMRRFVDGELLGLQPEFRREQPRGKVVALVDAGPGQAGAGRLVQLAALVVLHRRAEAHGTELVVGVLGDRPGEWLTGSLAELLPAWLASRRERDPDTADVLRADEAVDGPDEAWLLTSPALAARTPGRRRVLTSEIAEWGPDGATSVRITLAGATTELPLPERGVAVRALRGTEFARGSVGRASVGADEGGDVQKFLLPAFTSQSPTLLARGGRPDKLLVARIPGRHHPPRAKVVKHGMPGPVVAAARIGSRLIALATYGGALRIEVIGRPLGSARRTPVPHEAVGLTPELLGELLQGPLLPVELDGDRVRVPLAGVWWRLGPDGSVTVDGAVGRPGATRPGGPPFSWAHEARLYTGEYSRGLAGPYVYSSSAVGWQVAADQWRVRTSLGRTVAITVPAGDEVIGVAEGGTEVALVSLGAAGRLVRSNRAEGSRVLNRFSGGTHPPALHPGRPLIAAETRPGRIDIGDPMTGKVQLVIGSDT